MNFDRQCFRKQVDYVKNEGRKSSGHQLVRIDALVTDQSKSGEMALTAPIGNLSENAASESQWITTDQISRQKILLVITNQNKLSHCHLAIGQNEMNQWISTVPYAGWAEALHKPSIAESFV